MITVISDYVFLLLVCQSIFNLHPTLLLLVNLPPNLAESNLSDGQWFAHGLTLPTNLADIDSYLYKKARSKFEDLVARGRNSINSSLTLHTTKAKHIKVEKGRWRMGTHNVL